MIEETLVAIILFPPVVFIAFFAISFVAAILLFVPLKIIRTWKMWRRKK